MNPLTKKQSQQTPENRRCEKLMLCTKKDGKKPPQKPLEHTTMRQWRCKRLDDTAYLGWKMRQVTVDSLKKPLEYP